MSRSEPTNRSAAQTISRSHAWSLYLRSSSGPISYVRLYFSTVCSYGISSVRQYFRSLRICGGGVCAW